MQEMLAQKNKRTAGGAMMPKAIKKLVSVCGAVVLAFGVIAASSFLPATAAIAEADSYYATITATGGNELLGQVHDLITTTHMTYSPYAYSRDYAQQTDPGLDGNGVLEFYTHETINTFVGSTNASGKWNREHVWPKALSNGLWGTDGGGADLHHLRPSEYSLNGTRANYKYGEVVNGQKAYSKTLSGTNSQLGGYLAAGAFEPLDNVKGDVARIVMYVYTHYNTYQNVSGTTNGSGNAKYFGTLYFTHIMMASSEQAAKELILKWNALDPVDDIEEHRNEEVYRIQGNRNPFIDHSEYAEAIWCDEPLGGGGSQSNKHLDDFHAAVEGIVTEGSLALRLASLEKAANALLALTESEKESASEDVAALNLAIDNYNKYVASMNVDAESANKAAIDSAGEFLNR